MELIKTLVIAGMAAAGAYLFGRQRQKLDQAVKENKDVEAVVEAQKCAANLSDADCDALQRMYDKFKSK